MSENCETASFWLYFGFSDKFLKQNRPTRLKKTGDYYITCALRFKNLYFCPHNLYVLFNCQENQ
jgi:hypothetical protein